MPIFGKAPIAAQKPSKIAIRDITSKLCPRCSLLARDPVDKKPALLQSEWVILSRFSDGLEHTGQDFQPEILLIT
jgi:hypothetical protein